MIGCFVFVTLFACLSTNNSLVFVFCNVFFHMVLFGCAFFNTQVFLSVFACLSFCSYLFLSFCLTVLLPFVCAFVRVN